MDLQKIAIFIQVFKLGSFAEAGRSLDLDPSVISRAISLLEHNVGVRLFHRTTRKLSPTEEGQSFFKSVEPLIAQLNSIKNSLQDQTKKPSGVVRLTTPVSFGVLILNPLLPQFFKKYPDVQIDYLMTDSVLNLTEERIDVAVRLGHLDDSSFVAKKLTSLEYIVCASPKYLKHNKPIRQPSDLTLHNCSQFLLPGFSSGWIFKSKKNENEEVVRVNGQLRASNAFILKESTLLGFGISLLAKVLIKDELEKGTLVNLFPKHSVTATEFNANSWLLYPSKEYVPAKTKALIEFLSHEISPIA